MPINYDNELNPQQRAAVFHGGGPALVIAGAGTGKTRTLIYRVARLVETGHDPKSILLLTFTRRAAQEMLRRTARLLEDSKAQGVAGGTFHAFAHAVLRTHARHAGLPHNFTVLDRSDAEDVIQHVRTELGFAGKNPKSRAQTSNRRFPQKRTLAEMFSKAVNTQTETEAIVQKDWPQFIVDLEGIRRVRDNYTAYKRERGLLDYDDLLLSLLRLLSEIPDVRGRLARRFGHILVDEYQDMNRLQAQILKLLGLHRNVMAVGDDAQAIYTFRGADFRNIIAFPEDFPSAMIYRIEENYRSQQPILDVANAIMERAARGYGKKLFGKRGAAEKPKLVGCDDEAGQAAFITNEILRLREEGIPLEHMAVLFRSSYHSFELEAELSRRNIPFVKYGGFKFAEAAHIKDALAHLRWAANSKDLIAAQRCLLVLEGVGPVAARAIADAAAEAVNLASGLGAADAPSKARSAITHLAETFAEIQKHRDPAGQLQALFPYMRESIAERFDDHPKRVRDLEHLVGIAKRFSSPERFLSSFSIDPPTDDTILGVTAVENEEEPLVLSTIHSAKGLEWKAVFVLSVLDGCLPQDYSFRSTEELEEERRLLYVAMTRAKDHLTLTYPATLALGAGPSTSLRMNDSTVRRGSVFSKPSQFLDGISEDILPHSVVTDEELFKDFSYEGDVA